jgi:ubiquinone/menaquinone biosynthesis C-methylase UbiE
VIKLENREFNPGISHHYFLLRSSLLKGIRRQAGEMKGRMMDFGCGTKPYKPLFTGVTEYVGVDFQGEGHSHDNEQIDVFYDGKTLPFPDASFDCVLATEVFEHIFNLEEVLREIHRVLKPGGRMIVTTPFAFQEHEMPNDFARYSSIGLQSLLERNGFTVLSLEKTSNFVESVFQLWGLYWYTHIFPHAWFGGGILARCFHFMNNCCGRLAAWILPKKTDMFLNLVVLASR